MDFQRTLSCQECHGWVHNYGPPTREESSYVRSMLRTSTRSSNYRLNNPLATRITNWIILSETARIFDSLGLVDPVVLPAKLLLQALWQLEVSWDKSVSQDIYTEFKDYLADFKSKPDYHSSVRVRQRLHLELHGFCDASEKAPTAHASIYGLSMFRKSWSIWSVQNHASLLSKQLAYHTSSFVESCYYQNWWERYVRPLALNSRMRRIR